MKDKTSSRALSWLLPHLTEHGWRIAAAAVMGTLAVACAGALMYTSGYLISRSSLQPYNILMVYVPIVLVRAFGFGKAIIQYVERLVSHDAVLRILSAMRIRLYRTLEPQAIHLRSRYRTGDILGLLAEDIEQLQNVYLRLGLPIVTAFLICAAGLLTLGWQDGLFAWLMLLYVGFMMFTVPAVVLIRSRSRRRRQQTARSSMYQELTDTVFGMADWMLSGRTERAVERFRHRQQSVIEQEKHNRRTEWRTEWLMQCAIGGAVVLMTVWAAMRSAEGHLAPEWIAACALAVFPLLEAVLKAGQSLVTAPDYQMSLRRLANLEEPKPPDERSDERLDRQAHHDASHDPALIRFTEVSYRYAGSTTWSVRDVSLQIRRGERIALIGRSGAGKSTLYKLLLGELKPDAGRVTIANIDAVHTREQHDVSVMNQHPYVFDTSIANNIRLGRPGASDDDVRSAAEAAGLHDLLQSLPHGIETPVREAGSRFSGGERQRIALARILLQDRPIVLLDEPTAGLDPLTEHSLISTLLRALDGKTIFWITHHLSGMEQMDQIVFMEQGMITMQGSHEQLLRREERYRKLYVLDRPDLYDRFVYK